MFEITRAQKIGKIYQVIGKLPAHIRSSSRVVQTFGRPIPGSIKCTASEELCNALDSASNTGMVVYSISSFVVDDGLYMRMRMSNCRGVDLFLYTIESHRVWYADSLV